MFGPTTGHNNRAASVPSHFRVLHIHILTHTHTATSTRYDDPPLAHNAKLVRDCLPRCLSEFDQLAHDTSYQPITVSPATAQWLPLAARSRPLGQRTGYWTRGSRRMICYHKKSKTSASRCAMSSNGSTNTWRRYSHRTDSMSHRPIKPALRLTLF